MFEGARRAGFKVEPVEIVIVLEPAVVGSVFEPAACRLATLVEKCEGRLRVVGLRQGCETRVCAGPAEELVLVSEDEVGLRAIINVLQLNVVPGKLVVPVRQCAVAGRP